MRPEPAQPACLDNSWPYDVLIDDKTGDRHEHALRDARRICGTCELQIQCLSANRTEQWAAAILGVDHRRPPVTRENCGSVGGRKSHQLNSERPCAPCKAAEARARAINRQAERAASGPITDLRAAHAAHTELRKEGVDPADMPIDIVAGEKAYQAARVVRRRQGDAA